MNFKVILFPDFETLDVFGPVEVLGKTENPDISYYSEKGGLISNKDGIKILTEKIEDMDRSKAYTLLIPGGLGTRKEIDNLKFIEQIKESSENARYVLTVCTGSALLAKSGLLNGRKATSNKRSFGWVKESSDKVQWIKQARWVVDGNFYTSSGVSAGIDMALGFVADIWGNDIANSIAFSIEYNWQENKEFDNFCDQ